jgi:hypothetical protein
MGKTVSCCYTRSKATDALIDKELTEDEKSNTTKEEWTSRKLRH